VFLFLSDVPQMEYRMAVRQVAHEDFIEGVRAALVDKDRRPAWLMATTHQPTATTTSPPPPAAAATAGGDDGPVQQQQQQQECSMAGSNSQDLPPLESQPSQQPGGPLSTPPPPPNVAQPLYGEEPSVKALPGNRFSVQHLFSPLPSRQP